MFICAKSFYNEIYKEASYLLFKIIFRKIQNVLASPDRHHHFIIYIKIWFFWTQLCYSYIPIFNLFLFFQLLDVCYMVIIFLVLIIAWGFARFSILYPANEASFRNGISTENFLEKMFVVPSFGIFGELFMGSPHENSSKLLPCQTKQFQT